MPEVRELLRHGLRGPGIPVEALGRMLPTFGPALADGVARQRRNPAADLASGSVAPVAITVHRTVVDLQATAAMSYGSQGARAMAADSEGVSAPVRTDEPRKAAATSAGTVRRFGTVRLLGGNAASAAAAANNAAAGSSTSGDGGAGAASSGGAAASGTATAELAAPVTAPARFHTVRMRAERPRRLQLAGLGGGRGNADADGSSSGGHVGTSSNPYAVDSTGASTVVRTGPQPFAMLLMLYLSDLFKVRPLSHVAPSPTITSVYQVRVPPPPAPFSLSQDGFPIAGLRARLQEALHALTSGRCCAAPLYRPLQLLCMDLLPAHRFTAISTTEISARARALLMRQVRCDAGGWSASPTSF